MSGERTAERCVACGADLRLSCDQVHPQHDCYHPGGHERPQPDWADVREAARKAGWVRTGNRIVSAWTVKGPDGEDDDRHGWAAVYPHHRKIHLTGPGEGTRFNRSFADLVDPSPAQVLGVARGLGLVGLVGLGGDSDER